jgi:transposase
MTDLQLYQQLLGLTAPWAVQRVEVDPEQTEVRVYVAPAPDTRFACPECQQPCPGYDTRDPRRWRHLDSCGFITWLLAEVPRVQCPTHGVRSVAVPWAGAGSRFTQAFACFAVTVLRATQQQTQAALLLPLTEDEVAGLMARSVAAGLGRREEAAAAGTAEVLETLTLDEKQCGPGQEYLTVLGDPEGQRVWDVTAGREQEAVANLLETCLDPAQRSGVRTVALDLWAAFGSACRTVLPQARLAYDRFHAAQELNRAVDQTRREEHRRLRAEAKAPSGRKHGRSVLSDTRYLWLHAAEHLTAEECTRLKALLQEGLETAQVWQCKEAFREFFTQPDAAAGRRFLNQWIQEARTVDNPHLTAVAAQFERHQEKLIAALETGVTNSFGEYLNGRIQILRERARGFRNAAAFRVAILFHLGKLDLCPHGFP